MTVTYYPGIDIPSQSTAMRRNSLKARLDEFCGFKWRGFDAFENFGAFILNNKNGSLPLYAGSSFKNSYTSAQFNEGENNLNGVTFTAQQISFTIGVYWFSIKEFNIMLDWLNPYEVDDLSFTFERSWHFLVKLNSMKVGTREVLGHDTVSSNTSNTSTKVTHLPNADEDTYRYYTEIQLSFDIQGQQCALGPRYEWNSIQSEIATGTLITTTVNNNRDEYRSTNLSTPFLYNWDVYLNSTVPNSTCACSMELNAIFNDTYTKELFRIELVNVSTNNTIHFQYDSLNGILFYRFDTGSTKILSLVSTGQYGKRIIEELESTNFLLAGTFDNAGVDLLPQIDLCLTVAPESGITAILTSPTIVCYPRRPTL